MSSDGVVLLRCGNCGRNLSGLPDDVLYLCAQCCLVWQLNGDGMAPVAIETVAPSQTAGCVYLPFWMVDAEIEVSRKILRPLESSSLVESPKEFDPGAPGLDEEPAWKARETLLIPAFNTDRALSVGKLVTDMHSSLRWSTDCPRRLDGGCIDLDEALRVAPGIVLAAEASKPGHLAYAQVVVSPLHSRIAAVPFTTGKDGFSVAGARLVLPYNSVADARAILDIAGSSY
jgi:hypothetical protein